MPITDDTYVFWERTDVFSMLRQSNVRGEVVGLYIHFRNRFRYHDLRKEKEEILNYGTDQLHKRDHKNDVG